jgi:hypothetical protein
MKIYLTKEAKQEIEAKIAELEQFSPIDTFEDYTNFGKKQQLKEILSSAIILPVEESWHQLFAKNMISATYNNKFKDDTLADVFEKEQTQGVIIQPK